MKKLINLLALDSIFFIFGSLFIPRTLESLWKNKKNHSLIYEDEKGPTNSPSVNLIYVKIRLTRTLNKIEHNPLRTKTVSDKNGPIIWMKCNPRQKQHNNLDKKEPKETLVADLLNYSNRFAKGQANCTCKNIVKEKRNIKQKGSKFARKWKSRLNFCYKFYGFFFL